MAIYKWKDKTISEIEVDESNSELKKANVFWNQSYLPDDFKEGHIIGLNTEKMVVAEVKDENDNYCYKSFSYCGVIVKDEALKVGFYIAKYKGRKHLLIYRNGEFFAVKDIDSNVYMDAIHVYYNELKEITKIEGVRALNIQLLEYLAKGNGLVVYNPKDNENCSISSNYQCKYEDLGKQVPDGYYVTHIPTNTTKPFFVAPILEYIK